MRSSTKIAIGFVAVATVGWFGYQMIAERMAFSEKFEPIKPGSVTLLGVNRKSGYKIIVANQMAQLVKVSNAVDFSAPQGREDESSDDSGPKKRLPLSALLKTLQGDEKGLDDLVMNLNEVKTDELPPNPKIWEAADIQKALDGDKSLSDKLEKDLNTKLDGTPLAYLNSNAVFEGIVLRLPVPVKVRVGANVRQMTGHILKEFQTRLMTAVYDKVKESQESKEKLVGYYSTFAKEALDNPKRRQNVSKDLATAISPETLKTYAEAPEMVASNTTIVVNQDQIESASKSTFSDSNGKAVYKLNIDFSNEGRLRLWQYSRGRIGSQLLLTVNGMAIAAPAISHDLSSSNLTISPLLDESLVQDAVDAMNKKRQ